MNIETKHLEKTISEHTTDMHGKIVVITGTTSGTGYVCARELLKLGAKVFLLNRESERSRRSQKELLASVRNADLVALECDLQDLSSVKKACQEIQNQCKKIDVLCFNAGVMAFEDYATKDGYDVQMQTNMLSNFVILEKLLPLLEKSDQARIVNHSSMSRLGSPLEIKYFSKDAKDLGGNGTVEENTSFSGPRWERYHQTKLANFVFTYLLNDRFKNNKQHNMMSTVAHPGLAATNLITTSASVGGIDANGVFMKSAQSAEDGACGLIRACADPKAKAGDFFGPKNWTGFAELLIPEEHLISTKNKETLKKAYESFVDEHLQ